MERIQLHFDISKLTLGDIGTVLTSPHTIRLERDCTIYCDVDSLLDFEFVNALGTLQNRRILFCAINFYCNPFGDMGRLADEQETKDIVEKAMEIMDQKLFLSMTRNMVSRWKKAKTEPVS